MVFNKSMTCKSELSQKRERFPVLKKKKKGLSQESPWAISEPEQLGPHNSVGIKNGLRSH